MAQTARNVPSAHTDARVDAKIASAAPELQPVLVSLRELVQQAVPDATETVKWGMPFWELNGTILANMGIFKRHCSFGFWSKSMTEHLAAHGLEHSTGAGSLGRLTRLEDLPSHEAMLGYLRTAAEHIRQGFAEIPRNDRKRGPDGNSSSKPTIPVPPAFAEALAATPEAQKVFDGFPPSCRREYLVWITEAKWEETRTRRIAQAVAQLSQGKRYNWQYGTNR